MGFFVPWFRYSRSKLNYAINLKILRNRGSRLLTLEDQNECMRFIVGGQLTYLYKHKGPEMAPTLSEKGNTILVRKVPMSLFVGDIVVLKDPENDKNYIIRRLAALPGDEVVSTREEDEPLVLNKTQVWVSSDNNELATQEAKDSRWFGPVRGHNIVGRVLYYLQSSSDHGPLKNSEESQKGDSAIIEFELDVKLMLQMQNY